MSMISEKLSIKKSLGPDLPLIIFEPKANHGMILLIAHHAQVVETLVTNQEK